MENTLQANQHPHLHVLLYRTLGVYVYAGAGGARFAHPASACARAVVVNSRYLYLFALAAGGRILYLLGFVAPLEFSQLRYDFLRVSSTSQ